MTALGKSKEILELSSYVRQCKKEDEDTRSIDWKINIHIAKGR